MTKCNVIQILLKQANGKHQNYLMSKLMAQFQITRKNMCIVSHTFFFFPSVQSRRDKGQDIMSQKCNSIVSRKVLCILCMLLYM